jgi:hypothetical protein
MTSIDDAAIAQGVALHDRVWSLADARTLSILERRRSTARCSPT